MRLPTRLDLVTHKIVPHICMKIYIYIYILLICLCFPMVQSLYNPRNPGLNLISPCTYPQWELLQSVMATSACKLTNIYVSISSLWTARWTYLRSPVGLVGGGEGYIQEKSLNIQEIHDLFKNTTIFKNLWRYSKILNYSKIFEYLQKSSPIRFFECIQKHRVIQT